MALPRRFLPSIASLRALEALDRLCSATAAAEALALTQSAVSRQIQALEEQLGVTLIVRDGRRIVLTQDAVQYAAEVRAALNQIAQASLKLTANPSGGALNLAILPTFGMRWLVPRLPDFARSHPEVTLNLSTRIKPFSFAMEPFDAAIHFGEADWPGTRSMRLRGEAVLAVCAPDLIETKPPTSAASLLDMPLMHIETRPGAWRAWFAAQGVQAGRVTGTTYDQFATITQAALHGLGVALLPEYLSEADLAAGRLVVAWGGPTPSPGAYHLIWPDAKSGDAALIKFREWLATQIGEDDLLPR
ncbi:LysR family transcriptional regulator [Pelagivirga sediminicola]|uniref:LysR family transcriptional regulator n=1 Tax=Pelagivirga sediminicola TaxID=2170575 RepID=A0A2T7GAZ2_9RHOB|nr:LysR substrate-binding domain-containing protein [Pelagivirga sediminicola]PVA11594.1 LysR family transcriptional regulator [Pelagivirga sediminicola]